MCSETPRETGTSNSNRAAGGFVPVLKAWANLCLDYGSHGDNMQWMSSLTRSGTANVVLMVIHTCAMPWLFSVALLQ